MDNIPHKYTVIRIQCYIIWFACLCLLPLCHNQNISLSIKSDKKEVKRDTYVIYGQNLTINCTVHAEKGSNITSDDIVFLLGGKKLLSRKVDQKTRTLFIPKPARGQFSYICAIDNELKKAIFQPVVKVVYVGTRLNVTDFKCFSDSLITLTCSWTKPTEEIIRTNYELTYYINGEVSNNCRLTDNERNMSCILSKSTNPPYRLTEPTFHFRLKTSNHFGANYQSFTIDHFSIVKPQPPQDLKTTSIDSHAVELQWNIDGILIDKLQGFIYRINYVIQELNDTIYEVNTKDLLGLRKSLVNFKITDLPYANVKYQLRVFIKTMHATSDEFWSLPALLNFSTASEIPQRPPELPAGAFSIQDYQEQRFVYVFWKQLKKYEEGGPNFKYNISFKTDGVIKASEIHPGYLTLHVESKNQYYLDALSVNIRSKNEIGLSANNSFLYIPANTSTRDLRVYSFTTYSYGNGTYDLSWNVAQEVDNYTLFWCVKDNLPTACQDIDYKIIEKSRTDYRIHLTNNVNNEFAISANRGFKSSGMIKSKKCTFSIESLSFHINFNNITQGKRNVTLNWSLDCIYKKGLITGYNITYCVVNATQSECEGKRLYKYINDHKTTNCVITELSPFTIYRFEINANTTSCLRESENPRYIRTLEDAPSKPKVIAISDIKNDSFVISLSPPDRLNGNIKNMKYIIKKTTDETKSVNIENGPSNITINGLHSYTTYNISVVAHNEKINKSSEPTDPIIIRTRIGPPSTLDVKKNDTILFWDPPEFPGGPIIQYQVKIVTDTHNQKIINLTELRFVIDGNCEGANKITYQVRAVSIDNDTHHSISESTQNVLIPATNDSHTSDVYRGQWSPENENTCIERKNFLPVYIIFAAGLLAIIASATMKAYRQVKSMMDIAPKFPIELSSPYILKKMIDKTNNPHSPGQIQAENQTVLANNNYDETVGELASTFQSINEHDDTKKQSKNGEDFAKNNDLNETVPLLNVVPMKHSSVGNVQITTGPKGDTVSSTLPTEATLSNYVKADWPTTPGTSPFSPKNRYGQDYVRPEVPIKDSVSRYVKSDLPTATLTFPQSARNGQDYIAHQALFPSRDSRDVTMKKIEEEVKENSNLNTGKSIDIASTSELPSTVASNTNVSRAYVQLSFISPIAVNSEAYK